jgi:hypothetical protein
MTEAEWLLGIGPRPMHEFLASRDRATARKNRLLMCALARVVWDYLPDGRSRSAVKKAEAFADGLTTPEALRRSARLADQAHQELYPTCLAALRASKGKYPLQVRKLERRTSAAHVAVAAASEAPISFSALDVDWKPSDPTDYFYYSSAVLDVLSQHIVLFHEMFSNPFHSTTLDPDCLTLAGGTAVKLAREMYERQRFEGMPVLADALEDAGCDDADILDHCREPGMHFRGCWVMDLLLGKE